MQIFALLASAVILVWLIFVYGIEAALTFATLLSGGVWLGYKLFGNDQPVAVQEGQPASEDAPLLLDYSRSLLREARARLGDSDKYLYVAADAYRMHPFVAAALKKLPREEVFVQTKTRAKNAKAAQADIERFRRELGTS